MIRVQQLSVRGVLHDVSLEVSSGETVVVSGTNGSGKSLLARAVAGLEPAAGSVTVGGLPASKRKARRQLGYLPQQGALYGYLTAEENLRFFAAMAGVGWRTRRKVAGELLELIGLHGLAQVEADRLTPGQRQRLAIARALAGDPRALVLDEPLAHLDADGRLEVGQMLSELTRMNKAVLITTGDPAGLAATRVLQLEGGRLKGGEVV